MTTKNGGFHSNKRSHIVLIPGFAGFDALGQLEYYGGLTDLFKKWKRGNEVFHYFDNLPTAAVATRARRLREYLAKRIARGEIFPGDDVTLVGHSTGGLDIRRLLRDLSMPRESDHAGNGWSFEVAHRQEIGGSSQCMGNIDIRFAFQSAGMVRLSYHADQSFYERASGSSWPASSPTRYSGG